MNLTDYTDVTELLRRHGFHFSKSMGQNFLTAAWVPERIAAESVGLIGGRAAIAGDVKVKQMGVAILHRMGYARGAVVVL